MVARFEDDIKAIKKNHTENASRDPLDHKSAQESIERLERAIERIKAEYKEFDPQLPDSIGYWTGTKAEKSFEHDKSVFRSYLFRKDHVFTFESTQYLKPPVTMEKQEQQFRALLASFRTREMHEIPSELGICIPYGFLPDDGRTAVEIKQSLRWADAPSVLYTIETGSVRANNMKSTVVHAVANAGVGLFGSAEEAAVKRFVTQRIGPKQVKIGGTTGEQGGVAYRITKPGKAPYEAYSVYTGFSGWLGTDVLPYVIVDMQTRTTEQAPELKQEPPPFKQSMARLEGLLKYMRLRPTTPVMPELR